VTDVTLILGRNEQGDGETAEQLLPLVYAEPRMLAAARMAKEMPGQTLQATELLHKAYHRLFLGCCVSNIVRVSPGTMRLSGTTAERRVRIFYWQTRRLPGRTAR
jgi:hypothetical protein